MDQEQAVILPDLPLPTEAEAASKLTKPMPPELVAHVLDAHKILAEDPTNAEARKTAALYELATTPRQDAEGNVIAPAKFAPIHPLQMALVDSSAQKPDISKTESALRGASQGATFGFQDEISPYIEKGIADLTGNEAYKNKSAEDLRPEYVIQNKQAAEANPWSYFGGQVGGNILTTAPLPGLMAASKVAPIAVAGGLAQKVLNPATTALGEAGPVFGGGLAAGLRSLGISAADSAAQGGIYAGLQGAGNANEGERLKGAAEAGKTGAELGAVLGPAGKVASEGIAKAVLKGIQGAQGLPDRVVSFLQSNPEKISMLEEAAKDKDSAIANISEELANKIKSSYDKTVTQQNDIIDDIISRAGNKKIDAQKVINAFDSEIGRLDKGGITPPVKSAIRTLETMRDDFLEKNGIPFTQKVISSETKGLNLTKAVPTKSIADVNFEPIEGAQMPGIMNPKLLPTETVHSVSTQLPAVTADVANILRKEVDQLAKPAYQRAIGDNPVVAKSSVKVAAALRSVLEDVDEHLALAGNAPVDAMGNQLTIKGANKILGSTIKNRQEIASRFGAKSFEDFKNQIDPADIQKILSRSKLESKASDLVHLDELKNQTGIDIPHAGETIDAIKALNPDSANALSRIKTGFATYLPMMLMGGGFMSGHATGSTLAEALLGLTGLGAGVAMQSPGARSVLARAPSLAASINPVKEQLGEGLLRAITQNAQNIPPENKPAGINIHATLPKEGKK